MDSYPQNLGMAWAFSLLFEIFQLQIRFSTHIVLLLDITPPTGFGNLCGTSVLVYLLVYIDQILLHQFYVRSRIYFRNLQIVGVTRVGRLGGIS